MLQQMLQYVSWRWPLLSWRKYFVSSASSLSGFGAIINYSQGYLNTNSVALRFRSAPKWKTGRHWPLDQEVIHLWGRIRTETSSHNQSGVIENRKCFWKFLFSVFRQWIVVNTESWEHRTPGTVDCRCLSARRNEPRMERPCEWLLSHSSSVSSKEGDAGDACKTTGEAGSQGSRLWVSF